MLPVYIFLSIYVINLFRTLDCYLALQKLAALINNPNYIGAKPYITSAKSRIVLDFCMYAYCFTRRNLMLGKSSSQGSESGNNNLKRNQSCCDPNAKTCFNLSNVITICKEITDVFFMKELTGLKDYVCAYKFWFLIAIYSYSNLILFLVIL